MTPQQWNKGIITSVTMLVLLAIVGLIIQQPSNATTTLVVAPNLSDPAPVDTESVERASDLDGDGLGEDALTDLAFRDGSVNRLPLLEGSDTVLGPITTNNPLTPPLGPNSQVAFCWSDVRDYGLNNEWYMQAIDRYSAELGFTWAEVLRAADDPAADCSFRIGVFNIATRDQLDRNPNLGADIRNRVRPLVGDHADTLDMLVTNCVVNTRLVNETASPFVDCQPQVRVVLLMPAYNADNVAVGLKTQGGILADCWNLFWIPSEPEPTEPPPTVPPTEPTPEPTPTPTPTEPTPEPTPVCPDGPLEGQPVPQNGLCPKDSNDSVNENPDVPEANQGPGVVPPNGEGDEPAPEPAPAPPPNQPPPADSGLGAPAPPEAAPAPQPESAPPAPPAEVSTPSEPAPET